MLVIGYIIIIICMILLGQVVGHLNKKMPPVVSEEITYKEFFSSLKTGFKIDIKYSIIMSIIACLLYTFLGLNVTTILYILAIPMLMIVFSIDYRFQLIPDEAHIYLGVLGIVNLLFNLHDFLNYILGLLVGGGIFLAIAGFAILILKKEGMGFGDVKLMAALGFLFGVKNILAITLCSFFIGAIIGGILLIIKRKGKESYIPFGPFIVIGTILIMFFGADKVFDIYISVCSSISMFFTDIISNFVR